MKKALLVYLTMALGFSAQANDRFANVKIEAKQIKPSLYMLKGAGGNIGALVGADGILLVDDQFEPLAAKIEQAVFDLTEQKKKVTYVVNTHYHGDHTGANVYFSKSASVIAHENVRKRLSIRSKQGLPVITYQGGVKLHLNDQTVDVKHLAAGHTDGDSVIYFEQANVWHLGDLFFESRFPYVDLKSGGTVQGYLANLETLHARINDEALIIPGHGELTNRAGLAKKIAMIKATKAEVDKMKQAGLTLEQAIAKGLSKQWQDWRWSFITEPKWITTLYQ